MLPLLRKIASLGRQYLVLIKSDPSPPHCFWSREDVSLSLIIKSGLPVSVQVLCILHRHAPSPSLLCWNILFTIHTHLWCYLHQRSCITSTTLTGWVGFPYMFLPSTICSFLSKDLSLQLLIFLFTCPTET